MNPPDPASKLLDTLNLPPSVVVPLKSSRLLPAIISTVAPSIGLVFSKLLRRMSVLLSPLNTCTEISEIENHCVG